MSSSLPPPPFSEADRRKLREIGDRADIVIGIPSYNNARTIGHVVRAAHAGIAKYFPQYTALIVNSDGGSRDGTPQAVLSADVPDRNLLLVNTPLFPVHRLSLPYHGIPGKGSAFRMIFQIARILQAKVCAVVDSDLRSITPEWIDLLVRPVLYANMDFVAPYYLRHKYDGTITNSIIYPLTRSLYGRRVRQPIGGDFGISSRLLERYLARTDWETDVARFGVDIWMTTIALAEGYRVCQSFLGAKLHDPKDPAADLSKMLVQVVGSVFSLMIEYQKVWTRIQDSQDVDLFGFKFDVGLDPVNVNLERMLLAFRTGCEQLGEIWQMALDEETFRSIRALGTSALASPGCFHLENELWVDVIHQMACAYRNFPLEREHLLRSLTPLYLARVASWVIESEPLVSAEVEAKMEELCLCFERKKPELVARWEGRPVPAEPQRPADRISAEPVRQEG